MTFINDQGQVVEPEQARTEPLLKFNPSFYNGKDRLDTDQHATQAVEVDFLAS